MITYMFCKGNCWQRGRISWPGGWRDQRQEVYFGSQFSRSLVSNSLRPHGLQHVKASLSITNSWSLLKLLSIQLVMPSNHLILCHPLLLPPSIFPSIRVFSNESALHIRWPKYCHHQVAASVLPINTQDCSPLGWTGWISLLSKGRSRVLSNTTLQKHQLFGTAFFIVQLSHPYMTTGKTIAFTRRTFVGKVMTLLFNMLSRLVIALLPRSKRLFDGCSHHLQ